MTLVLLLLILASLLWLILALFGWLIRALARAIF